jgi:DNA adenine methylase
LLFGYAGSKYRLAPQFVSRFPPHSIYVSPFVGTAAEFAFKTPSRREIINDIDDNVYSVFAVLRDERLSKQLIHLLENSHDCQRLYYECYDRLHFQKLTLLDRAYCFLIIGNLGFLGGHPMLSRSYACGLTKKQRLKTLVAAVYAWRDRMKNVEVENIDAFDLIDMYDRHDVFAFCDPPYHLATCHPQLYVHNNFDHHRLVKRLQQFNGKAMVCGYAHGLYDVQLLGWRREVFQVSKCFGGRAPREEIVWMNYDENGNKINQDFKVIRAFERLPA